jgi:hypothetical protein
VNREYRGVPRVAQPDPAPQYWPATGGGGGGYAYKPKVISYMEFQALQRANGELPELDSLGGGAVINPLPNLGAPARADDDFGLLGVVESAAGALLGGGYDDSDSGDDGSGGAVEEDVFSDDSGDGSTPLGDAQPFEYTPDVVSGEAEELAASTNNPNYAAKMLGYDRKTFGDMIHAMKDGLDLGGADNVIWHDNGDVEFNGNIIGNMHDYN